MIRDDSSVGVKTVRLEGPPDEHASEVFKKSFASKDDNSGNISLFAMLREFDDDESV